MEKGELGIHHEAERLAGSILAPKKMFRALPALRSVPAKSVSARMGLYWQGAEAHSAYTLPLAAISWRDIKDWRREALLRSKEGWALSRRRSSSSS